MEDANNGTYTYLDKATNKLTTIDVFTGEEVITSLPAISQPKIPYTVPLAQAIYTLIREGKTNKQIASIVGMPSTSLIYQWMARYPDFAWNIKQAKFDRAHTFHDKIVEITERMDGEGCLDKETLATTKEVVSNYKWLAEKGNPQDYGASTKISGDRDNPLAITVIDTGIRRRAPVEVVDESEFDRDRIQPKEISDNNA